MEVRHPADSGTEQRPKLREPPGPLAVAAAEWEGPPRRDAEADRPSQPAGAYASGVSTVYASSCWRYAARKLAAMAPSMIRWS